MHDLATIQRMNAEAVAAASDYVDIVFDGPPESIAGRFVEVEDSQGRGIKFGEWLQRPDGYWVLRIPK